MARTVAYFISPHGFGHAARACAVIEAVWRRAPEVRFELFTQVPRWFFEHSLGRPVGYHPAFTDLGLVQRSSLEEDLEQTVRRLNDWIPFRRAELEPLAAAVTAAGGELVVCDIAPIGLAVAGRCGLPSILVENFTWDWIYRGYAQTEPDLLPIADYLAAVFARCDRRTQTEPICDRLPGSLRVPPVSRARRQDRETVRRRLGVPLDAELVMVTMGGVEWDYQGIEAKLGDSRAWLVIPGSTPEPRRCGRALLLPHRSDFYHPDLIHAADAVIGKLGYSTVAEVYSAGLPFGFVPRATFPESPPLEAWVSRHLPHRRIAPEAFAAGGWLDEIEPLLALSGNKPGPPDGGDAVASVVLEIPTPS